jgi:F-type H+-transporting ATPase subunit b
MSMFLTIISILSFTPFQPSPGLALWSLAIFILFWVIIGKFAFKPIAEAIEKREFDIQTAIDQAKLAREEMAAMKSDNEKLLAEAREERSKILQEAKDLKNKMLNEAKDQAKEEANKILMQARKDIDNQKAAAISEVKNQVGDLALEIAEKVIRQQLKSDKTQQDFVQTLVQQSQLN